MRKRQIKIIAIAAAVVLVLGGIGIFAATNLGSSSDPLVSMSYINETLTPALQAKLDEQIKAASGELQESFANAISEKSGGFTTVKMSSGEKMTCSAGSEIVLVSGSVQVVNKDTVSDVTAGISMGADEDLKANHMYIVTASSIAITAAGDASVMVRGTATVA